MSEPLTAVLRFAARLLCLGVWLGSALLAQPSPTYKEIKVLGGATIHGTVALGGNAPACDVFAVTKNPSCCGLKKMSPRLVVGKNNGVAKTIIFLEGIHEGKSFAALEQSRLTQEHCEYSPHISIHRLGADLEICNNDPILHNVHAYCLESTPRSVFNIAQPIKGQRSSVKGTQFNTTGIVQATCDANHPWMSAYIMVADNPYAAITDANGEYTITDVPPGKYVLKLWHEGVKIARKDLEKDIVKKYYFEEPYEEARGVEVSGGATLQENFELKLR